MKKELTVSFVDTFGTAENYFRDILNIHYDVKIVDGHESHDIMIFGDSNFGANHKNLGHNAKVSVFYTGEPVRSWEYDADFKMTFDFITSPEHFRLPLYVLEIHSWLNNEGGDLFDFKPEYKREDVLNRKFCSYVQANVAEPRRSFVRLLNERRRVDCAGPDMNNMVEGWTVPRPGGHKSKVDFITNYKYNVAFENTRFPGYVTEKLLNAYMANTVPIYWGSTDDTIERDFPIDSMIYVNEYTTFEKVYEQIEELENDDEKYLKKLDANRLSLEDLNYEACNPFHFLKWWNDNVMRKLNG